MPRCPSCHGRLGRGAICPRDGSAAAGAAVDPGSPPEVAGFELGEALGSGGFASTWAARRDDGRDAAIKVSRVPSRAAADRLGHEAEALVRVGPPHVPDMLARGVAADGRPFLAMERLAADTLADEMAALTAPAPFSRVIEAGAAVARAVAAVHRAGLAHGDLKPENVFVVGGRARLIDFGVAGAATPEYMAPEQIRGAEPTAASDVYALGAMLYELACLRPPFVGDLPAVQHGHLSLRPPAPSALVEVPGGFDEVVMECLAKDPGGRPGAERVVEMLNGLPGLKEPGLEQATGDRRQATGDRRRGAVEESVGREPVVLMVGGDVTEVVLRRRGIVVGRRGEKVLYAFLSDRVDDPAGVARRVAEEVVARGGAVALHVAPLVVRRRAAGPPLLAGAALETGAWGMPATWKGVFATADFAAAEPVDDDDAPLTGREAEVAAARASLEGVLEGGRPGMFTAIGGPGLGKSRLARELGRLVTGAAPDAVIIAGAAPELSDGDALRALARARPVAVILDDAEEADDPCLDIVEYAALDGDGVRLWVAVCADPRLETLRPTWGRRARHHARVALAALAEEDASALAGHLLRPAEYPPEEALRHIARLADGVPLYLVELCRALRTRGAVRRAVTGSHYLDTAAVHALPRSTAIEWVAARALDGLSPELAGLARLCAALLPGFTRDEVDEISRALHRASTQPTADVDVGLFQLRARGLLTADGDGRHRFTSAALETGVARLLTSADRDRIHRYALERARRAAPTLAADPRALAARAHHAAAVGEAAEAAAAHMALAEDAARAHHHVDADRHYSAALAELERSTAADDAGRARALHGRGRVRYRVGRAADAIADLATAETLALAAGDRQLAAHAVFEQATALDWASDYTASAAAAARASALAPPGDGSLEAVDAMARGRAAWRADDVPRAIEALTHAAEAAAASGDWDTRVVSLLILGPALVRAGELARAEARFEEVFALALAAGDRLHLCAAHGNRMFLWSALKRPDLARADLRAAEHLARQIGHPGPERVATYNLAEDLYWSGEDDEALALARRSWFLQQRFVARPVAEDALLVARVAMACGEVDLARETIAWVRAQVPEGALSPASNIFVRMVDAQSADAGAATWAALSADAAAILHGDDLLEVLYWTVRRAGDPDLRRAALARGLAALDDFPIWRARFDRLRA